MTASKRGGGHGAIHQFEGLRGPYSVRGHRVDGPRTGNFWGSDVFLHIFCIISILFLDDHNFINNHPQDLKLVSNDAPCDLPQSALKFRL
jgi:hypothetical protein